MRYHFSSIELRLLRLVRPVFDWAKTIIIPGFDRIPLYDVGVFFVNGLHKGAIATRASAVAFSLIMAIFPAIIFIFTLIPYIPIQDFQQQLLELIQSIVPDNAYVAIQNTIEEIVMRQNSGLLSIGFAMALIFSTNGFVTLISSFNASVNVNETRNWWEIRAVSLLLVLLISLLVAIGVALITFTETVMNYLVRHNFLEDDFIFYLINGGKWIIIVAVFFFAFSLIYFIAPAHKSKWRFMSAGGTLATILAIVITIGFKFYINQFGRYNALYGSIGALPVIMLMVYLNCLAIIIGFELNVGILAAQRKKKSLTDISEAELQEN